MVTFQLSSIQLRSNLVPDRHKILEGNQEYSNFLYSVDITFGKTV